MKFNLIECSFSNILPFGNVTQKLQFKNGIYKIVGYNRDKGGSNGAGKTSIMNIISFAIYGKPFEDEIEDVQNYTNNSKKTPAKVELIATKNGEKYKIVRTKAGSSNSVELWLEKDGEWADITLGKGVTATNQEIINLVGMNFDLFCLSHIFSGNVVPFLKRSAADQRKIIDILFNTSELSEYADKAKELKASIEGELKVQNALKASAEQLAISSKQKIQDAYRQREHWEITQAKKLEDALALMNLEEIDYQAEILKFEDIKALKDYVKCDLQPIINELGGIASSTISEINKLKGQLAHLKEGNCPFCKQEFTSPEKWKEISNSIAEMEEIKLENDAELEKFKSLKAETELEINKLISSCKFTTLQQLNSHRDAVRSAKTNYENVQGMVNPFNQTISSLEEMAKEHSEFDCSELDRLTNDLEHVKLLIQLLTNRDSIVRTSLISSQTALLNSRISLYSKMLDLPQVLHFDSNMKCSVMEFGRATSYGNLSAGEKRRANLALSYAFRDLVTLKYGGMNILLMDEIDGGSLDVPACNSIIKSLIEVGGSNSIMVISHNEMISQKINNEISVVKECGFSTLSC